MKALRFPIALLLAISLLAVPAWAAGIEPGTGSDFFVRDTANVLSSATEDTIIDYNATLDEMCSGAQLVVVTVSYLSEDTDVAATRLMNDWGVGDAQQSNGMLLLLVANEHRGWLAVGAGLDQDFTDDMADEYLEDWFWDDVDRDRFDDAVLSLSEHLYDWYLDYYGVEQSGGYRPAPEPMPSAPRRAQGSFLTGLIALILLLVIIWVVGATSRFSRMRRWGYNGGFFPIFWFGGGRRYRSYRNQYRPQPPPPPPGGFGGPPPRGFRSAPPRSSSFRSSRSSGGGGFSRGSGGGRSSGSFHSSGHSGGGFHGGGGGHSGGGGGGRR